MFVCILDIGLNPFQMHSTCLQQKTTRTQHAVLCACCMACSSAFVCIVSACCMQFGNYAKKHTKGHAQFVYALCLHCWPWLFGLGIAALRLQPSNCMLLAFRMRYAGQAGASRACCMHFAWFWYAFSMHMICHTPCVQHAYKKQTTSAACSFVRIFCVSDACARWLYVFLALASLS